MFAAPEAAVAEKAPARPPPEPAAPERRARRRKPREPAKPGPFPAWMTWQDPLLVEAQAAQAKLIADDARRAREKPAEDAAEFHDDFASADPRRHARAAARLVDLKDAQLAAVQRAWRTTLGGGFYPFLYERSGKGTTPGIEEALSLLRRALVRDKAMQEEFGAAYAGQSLIDRYVWLMEAGFSSAKGDLYAAQALAALRDQTPAVRKAIRVSFGKRYGADLLQWLIQGAPRTEALVRAIAILREGDDRGGHVDLATVLIPPENSNRELPVRSLRVPFDQRKKLEAKFNAVFKGIARTPWAKTPDTLRDHLVKLDSIVHSNAPYHEALMLLHHDLTDAEKLYLTLTRRRDTMNESAVAVAVDLVRRGVGRKQLDADWERFVLGAEISGKARFFAQLPLREHIVEMFSLYKFTETKRHLLALIDQLGATEDAKTVDPAAAAAPKDWDAQDEARRAAEDRRLRAAEAVIKAVEGRVWSNDKAIVDALGEVAEVLRGRVARLRKRIADARARRDLDPEDHQALVRYYEYEAGKARAEDLAQRLLLTKRLSADDDPIRISYSQREAARLTLGDAPTPADKVWIAAYNHDWDDLVTLITQIWARGQIDQMHVDADKPGLDALGHQARLPFKLFMLISRVSGTPYHRRIMALSAAGISDANRGVLRIREEIKEGQAATGSASGADLASINALLEHSDLKPELRHKVLEAFAKADAAEGKPGKAPGETAEHYFLDRMEALFEGRTTNWEHLRDLLEPATTAAERRERVRDVRAAGKRGRLSFVTEAAARAWSTLSGDFLYEAEARSEDRLEFIRSATDEQLAPLMQLAGVKTREELSAYEFKTFQTRHGDVQGVENATATLIAGFVETLVEAGLSPLTGGAGLAAVIGAAVASIASMAAQEALLGPDYKAISGENFTTVLQSSLGTALTEFDLRKLVVDVMPLKRLEKYEKTQQTIQNFITGGLEHGISATSELTANVLIRGKWPTDADIARQADQMIARMISKIPSTQGTARYHPGNYRQYMPAAERVKNSVLFKLSIKATQAAATEITTVLISGTPDQTFVQQVMQVLWKEARGIASTTTKGVTSALAGAGSAHGGHALVDRMRRQHPDLFPPLLHQVLAEQYEKDPKLKDEHAAQQARGRKVTVDQFMLEKLRAPDPKGTVDPTKIRSKIEKELLTYSELLTGREKGTQGVLAYREKAKGIGAIAEEEAEPPGPDPALAGKGIREGVQRIIAADRSYQARKAADRAAWEEKEAFERLPLPAKLAEIKRRRVALSEGALDPAAHQPAPGAPLPLSALRVTALMKEHARLSPEHFAPRARLVAEVLEGETVFARGVLAGDPASLNKFLKDHGDWGQTIQILQTLGAGPEAARLGLLDHSRVLQAERNRLALALRKAGAAGSEHASTEVTSDLDLAVTDNNRRRAIETQMFHDYGEHWRSMWNLSFFGDATHLTRYATHAQLVSSATRGATQERLTNLAEHYAFTRMLWLADKSGRRDTRKFVENLAAELEIDLAHARDDMHRLGPVTARARLGQLEGEIEDARQQLDAAEQDRKSTPERRLQLAEDLAKLAMEANFLTKEANIAGGANRALLQGVKVEGPEAYQAFLNHTLMYVEHGLEEGSHRTYGPAKYEYRMVGSIQGAGIDDAALNAHGQVAGYAYRQDRLVNSKGAPLRDGVPANTNAALLAEKTRFEAAVLKPAGALKRAAMARLDVIAPSAPAKAHPAAAKALPEAMRPQKGMRPADKRAAATAPAPPPGFADARQFLDRLGEAINDPPGDFTTTLNKREIALDLDAAARWSAYLAERYTRTLGDAAAREDLRVIHAALVRLKAKAGGDVTGATLPVTSSDPAGACAELRPLLRALDVRLADAVAALAQAPGASDPDDLDTFHPAELGAEIARGPGAPRFDIDRTAPLTSLATGRFAQMIAVFGLSAFAADAVLIALARDVDRRYERLYRHLSPAGNGSATLDLILDLTCATPEEKFARRAELGPGGVLARFGLVALGGAPGDGALARTAAVAPDVADFLLGVAAPDGPSIALTAKPSDDRLDLDPRALARLGAVVARAVAARAPLSCRLTGPSDAVLRAGAEALAARVGRPLLLLDLDRLGGDEPAGAIPALLRRASLTGATAAIAAAPDAFSTAVRDFLAGTPFRRVVPIVVAARGDWRLDDGQAAPFATVELPAPDFALRLRGWRRAAKDAKLRLTGAELETLASRFTLSGRDTDRACRLAAADPEGPAYQRALAAAKAERGTVLAESARRLVDPRGWDALVLPAPQLRQLHEITGQVAFRDTVEDSWGFADRLRLGRGVCVLFAGPSGTGKTMAAGVLARALDLDLYRVDISRTVSKFIGETEKNLDRISTRRAAADAVLFFDEADTLFGKRTEVKDAHDRYANLEVGYLLQKMEDYAGLAILATNLRGHIDEAFIRRLRAVVEFPFPDEADRERIWRTIFPPQAPLDPDIDFAEMARDVRLTGGSIRNIALGAAYLAAAAKGPIRRAHLIEAAQAEYRKVGRAWTGAES